MSDIEFLSPSAPVSMANEWFEFATASHFWMQWRHRVLLQELKRAGGPLRNALEIGCGHGVAREMVEHDLGIPIDGCDLNLAALRMAKPGKGRVFVYNIFDQEPSMLDRYDAIFLLDVIEHIDDDAAFLTAALRHLRSGGLAVVNVPANTKLFSNYDKAVGHLRRYTAARLSHLLKNCGVAVEVVRPWGLLMLPLLLARKAVLRSVKRAATVRTGLVPPNSAAQLFMHGLKNIETALPVVMPFGTSLLAWGRVHNRGGN
jgi:SAM-dependent methyltransferase